MMRCTVCSGPLSGSVGYRELAMEAEEEEEKVLTLRMYSWNWRSASDLCEMAFFSCSVMRANVTSNPAGLKILTAHQHKRQTTCCVLAMTVAEAVTSLTYERCCGV